MPPRILTQKTDTNNTSQLKIPLPGPRTLLQNLTHTTDRGDKRRGASGPGGDRLPKCLGGQDPRAAAAGLGHDPEQPGPRAPGPGGSDRGDKRRGASGPGRDRLPERPGSQDARAAAEGLGHNPEQPG